MTIIKIQGIEEKRQGIHYEVDVDENPLGVGGMGQVYRGVRVDENRGDRSDVAIKFLFDDLPENIIDRARREASVKIHNENLVEMYGFIHIDEEIAPGKVHPRYHVVSELLHGVMLHDLLNGEYKDHNGEEVAFAKNLYEQYCNDRYGFTVFIIKSMLSGIMALHDNGYIHRDLDPSNVMITSNGKVKIIDYGITKKLTALSTTDKQLTTAGHFMGKAAYAAPELVMGDILHQNQTTDIYAVGIMLFQFIAEQLPFSGSTHEVLDMQLHNKMPLDKIKDKQLRKIIAKATAKKQQERYQSAAEFRVAIEQFGNALSKGNREFVPAETGESKLPVLAGDKKKISIAAAAAACLALAVGIGLWAAGRAKENDRLEQERMIAERVEALKSEMFDSSDPAATMVDSLSGYGVKSAGWWLSEAKRMLEAGDEKAAEGYDILKRIADRGYKSSSEAAYLIGRLCYENEQPDSLITLMRSNLGGRVVRDNRKAHEMNRLSVQLDDNFYKGLYELGCDYFAGEYRTNMENSQNIDSAVFYFKKGLANARNANDTEFERKCAMRLAELGIE